MKPAAKLIATFFGAGFFPVAPGTLTSFIIVLLYKFWFSNFFWPYFLVFILVLYMVGVWASTVYSANVKKKDPRTVVIDEAVGQLIALFTIPATWGLVLVSFFLFRVFDVIKPLFIKKAESFSSGWGIMLDDVLAGIYASILLNLYLLLR